MKKEMVLFAVLSFCVVPMDLFSGEGTRPVRLDVFDHARLDTGDIDLARETVLRLLQSAGVRSGWRECSHGRSCEDSNAPYRINVRLIPTRMAPKVVGDFTCGHRLADGTTILVYVPCSRDVARGARLSLTARSNPWLASLKTGHVMGLAVAHEVGHVLGLRHSTTGVMKARIDIDDLLALRKSRLSFSPPQAASLRLAMLEVVDAVVVVDARWGTVRPFP
jgi:hypothetical protein